MLVFGSNSLGLTAQQMPPSLLLRRSVGDHRDRAFLDVHEMSAKLFDYASLALILCPGAFLRSGALRAAGSQIGTRAINGLGRINRWALGSSEGTALHLVRRNSLNILGRNFVATGSHWGIRGIQGANRIALSMQEGLAAFAATGFGSRVAFATENNFAKSLLLGASQLYRNPTTMFPPSGHSLHEVFIEDGKWVFTLMGGYILYRTSKFLLKKWPVGMDLGLKTAFAFSAGRHQFRRINLSDEYDNAVREGDEIKARRLHHRLRNMAGESFLFTAISGFAVLSESPFGRRLNLDHTLGKAACSIDDILPDIVEKLKALIGARPVPHLASK